VLNSKTGAKAKAKAPLTLVAVLKGSHIVDGVKYEFNIGDKIECNPRMFEAMKDLRAFKEL
jgi:hypothetical protein